MRRCASWSGGRGSWSKGWPARGRAWGSMIPRDLCRSLVLGLLAGPVVAWFAAGVVYYYPVQEAALARGEVEQFALWPVLLLSAMGALTGVVLAWTAGDRQLPRWVKGAAFGILVGVGIVVI